MTVLSADQILQAVDRKTEVVDVPEWGGQVIVSSLTGSDRDAYEASLAQIRQDGTAVPNLANLRAKLVARALVDEDGNRIFTDQQINALGMKNADVIARLFEKAADLSGISPAAAAEISGNSDAAPSDGSTSA